MACSGCEKRKKWLREHGMWPGGNPRHTQRATRVHKDKRSAELEKIYIAEAQRALDEMDAKNRGG